NEQSEFLSRGHNKKLMSAVLEPPAETIDKPIEELETVTIRFAGDSGDGMQVTGGQFTATSAIIGNDISTLPDFPAEIRAPAGSLPGVSGYQLNFSSRDIRTPADEPQVLVAMNPARSEGRRVGKDRSGRSARW